MTDTAVDSSQVTAILAPSVSIRAERVMDTMLAGRSQHTRDTYTEALLMFGKWAGDRSVTFAIESVLGCTYREGNRWVRAYVADLQARGLAIATIQLRVSVLRSVVKTGRELGYIDWTLEDLSHLTAE